MERSVDPSYQLADFGSDPTIVWIGGEKVPQDSDFTEGKYHDERRAVPLYHLTLAYAGIAFAIDAYVESLDTDAATELTK